LTAQAAVLAARVAVSAFIAEFSKMKNSTIVLTVLSWRRMLAELF
jgi:hypothetical protein